MSAAVRTMDYGHERQCPTCRGWFPPDAELYKVIRGRPTGVCHACRSEGKTVYKRTPGRHYRKPAPQPMTFADVLRNFRARAESYRVERRNEAIEAEQVERAFAPDRRRA